MNKLYQFLIKLNKLGYLDKSISFYQLKDGMVILFEGTHGEKFAIKGTEDPLPEAYRSVHMRLEYYRRIVFKAWYGKAWLKELSLAEDKYRSGEVSSTISTLY